MRKIVIIVALILISSLRVFSQPQVQSPDLLFYSDPLVTRYILGGYMEKGKMHLISKGGYVSLPYEQKQNLVGTIQLNNIITKEVLITEEDTVEYWIIGEDGKPSLLDTWTAASVSLSKYLPIPVENTGGGRWFWYAGGQMTGSEAYFAANVSGRVGAFLYRDKLDASISISSGISLVNDESVFSAETGVMGRYFFIIKGSSLRPYLGAGATLMLKKPVGLEAVGYTGVSIRLGPGSLDFGLQYGTISSFRGTAGYTFYPKLLNKGKK